MNPEDRTQSNQEAATKPTSHGSGLTSGTILKSRYLIEKELGRGGIGAVYLARDKQLASRPVVVKVLLEDSLDNNWIVNKWAIHL